jgi:hypothetical protein
MLAAESIEEMETCFLGSLLDRGGKLLQRGLPLLDPPAPLGLQAARGERAKEPA